MKYKKTIMITFLILIMPLALADFNVCFQEGEQFSFCNNATNYYRCGNYESCTCESNGHNCRLCMSEYDEVRNCYNQGNLGLCNQNSGCVPSSGGSWDIEPPEIVFNSPVEGEVYGSNSVLFDVSLGEVGDAYYYDNVNGRSWKILFRDQSSYSKYIRLNEGYNNVSVKAYDGIGNEDIESITFYIDSKAPKIDETLPEEGYVNTVFTIKYDEENLQSVVLHYNQGDGWIDVVLDCPPGSDQTCSSSDIPLEDGEVQYYFTISDFATDVESDIITLMVDTTDPVITINEPQNTPYDNKKINLDIGLDDGVELLEYIDVADSRARWRKLCSNCDSYDKTKSFGEGFHDLIIRATDYAGNDNEEYISFMVDSKEPKVKRMEPRKGKYGNGEFYIKYQEDNLQQIELYYKEGSETEYTKVTKTDCPSGKDAECTFEVPELYGLEGLDYSYYFVLYDLATDVQSKEYEFKLDSLAPTFIKADKNVNGKYVYFDILLSEDSTLEYMDSYDGDRARFRRLCSNCDSYDRKKSFKAGHHDLTLRATDKAGNINEVLMSFDIG